MMGFLLLFFEVQQQTYGKKKNFMYIKGRLKLIRKYDCDFWNLTYIRMTKNRFFNYFSHSLRYKVLSEQKKKEFILKPKIFLKLCTIQGIKKSRQFFNPFFKQK
eukprot:TRINITY_DN84064_c0_g1_i1.p1 TRINITY_DN84064_c0_g1~~TRINITY_DN84064_c0_g1_i1.p1  ORF type:complete len:112 (-),score=2.17 TRINITY_DN84064_c0_g1_i1:182-493(-)